jgi:hypothetical protein
MVVLVGDGRDTPFCEAR